MGFISHSKSGPFGIQPLFDHSKQKNFPPFLLYLSPYCNPSAYGVRLPIGHSRASQRVYFFYKGKKKKNPGCQSRRYTTLYFQPEIYSLLTCYCRCRCDSNKPIRTKPRYQARSYDQVIMKLHCYKIRFKIHLSNPK